MLETEVASSCQRPIFTLLTDFGMRDAYVAEMKAVLLRHTRDAAIVDITHEIAPQDVLAGTIALHRAIASFPPGTIHIAVVDPGVGTARRLLLVQMASQIVLCPDNGLITWPARFFDACFAELTYRPGESSSTFHGRDILAPAAGMLAAGKSPESMSEPFADPVMLKIAPAAPGARSGFVLHIDRFGNATTSIPAALLTGEMSVRVRDADVGLIRSTYGDVAIGQPLALVGSSGLLEVAVRNGSAATILGLSVGDRVELLG